MKSNLNKPLREERFRIASGNIWKAIKTGVFKSEEERNTCLRCYMSSLDRDTRNALFIQLDDNFHPDEFSLRRSIARGKQYLHCWDFQMEPTVLPMWFVKSKIANE